MKVQSTENITLCVHEYVHKTHLDNTVSKVECFSITMYFIHLGSQQSTNDGRKLNVIQKIDISALLSN